MASDVPTTQTSDLTWLLTSLVQRVPHTRSALLLSTDGLKKHYHGLDADGADQLAAVASGLCSLARSVGDRFGNSNGVRQVVVELDDVMMFVTAAGSGTVLAVLAGREADVGVLGYEMGQLVKRVPSYLATPMRNAAAAPGYAPQ
jgi:predicted regulator of Ras-like GTPase activity (Roadblock/LC7/MglB family)